MTAYEHWPKNDPRFREVPVSVNFTLRFPSGVLANCDCSFNSAQSRRYRVHCAKGWIDMDPTFAYRGLELHTSVGMEKTQHQFEQVNHFAAEMEHLSECILENKKPRTPGEDGLADRRVMAAIEEAARTGKAVRV